MRILDRIVAWRRLAERIKFHRPYREAVLNTYIFESLKAVKTETGKRFGVYNPYRPRELPENLTPMEYLQKFNPEIVI